MEIKAVEDDKYDTLTNKNAKFLFYHSNDLCERQNLPIYRARHTIKFEDVLDLIEFQKQNWPYFIEKIETSEKNSYILNELSEKEILKDIINKFRICCHVYNTLYKPVSDKFLELISSLSHSRIKEINKGIHLNGWEIISNIRHYTDGVKLLKSIYFFYYVRFRKHFSLKAL